MIRSKLPTLKEKLGLIDSAKTKTKKKPLKVKKTKVGAKKTKNKK